MKLVLSAILLMTITSAALGAGNATTRPTNRNVTVSKYIKSTPQQDADAMAQAHRVAQDIQENLKVHFQEIQTKHFLIFTDWPVGEHGFLQTNLEGAYSTVSKAFEISDAENIFVGKLPVYMFNTQKDFKKYAADYDELNLSDGVTGYFAAHNNGMGHLAMWKPDVNKRYGNEDPVKQWAYTLTHEFTHAFVARYRTNRSIATWLNEGIAEYIANSKFPRPEARLAARQYAMDNSSIQEIFNEDGFKSAEQYPVMRTLVETLAAKDRAAFLTFFNQIKDGSDIKAALKNVYGLSYHDLEVVWRRYIQH